MTENEMIKAVYEDMREMKRQIKDLQLTLENETNRNIKIIAEGHLDLNRKYETDVSYTDLCSIASATCDMHAKESLTKL